MQKSWRHRSCRTKFWLINYLLNMPLIKQRPAVGETSRWEYPCSDHSYRWQETLKHFERFQTCRHFEVANLAGTLPAIYYSQLLSKVNCFELVLSKFSHCWSELNSADQRSCGYIDSWTDLGLLILVRLFTLLRKVHIYFTQFFDVSPSPFKFDAPFFRHLIG